MTFPPPPPQPPSWEPPPPRRNWRPFLLIRIGLAVVSAVTAFTVAVTHHHGVPEPTLALPTNPVTPPRYSPVPSTTQTRAPRIYRAKAGEKVQFTDEDSTTPDVEFTITKITVDRKCTEPYAQKSENGHFLALDVSIRTSPTMGGLQSAGLFSPFHFSVIGPDGAVEDGETLVTSPTFGCLAYSKLLPVNGLSPGRDYTATILLDSHNVHGMVVLIPGDGPTKADGWAWQLGEAA